MNKKQISILVIILSILLILAGKWLYDIQNSERTRFSPAGIPNDCLLAVKVASSPELFQKFLTQFERVIIQANQYRKEKKYDQAESVLREALPVYEECFGRNSGIVASLIKDLANDCCEQHKFAEGVQFYKRLIELDESRYGTKHLVVARHLGLLAYALNENGDYIGTCEACNKQGTRTVSKSC